MSDINKQTPGPAVATVFENRYGLCVVASGPANAHSGALIAQPAVGGAAQSNARLLAAAYTVFDGAGRKLGIDATAMAERLGPNGLVQVVNFLDSLHLQLGVAERCSDRAKADQIYRDIGAQAAQLLARFKGE